MSIEEIAKEVRRTPSIVEKFLKRYEKATAMGNITVPKAAISDHALRVSPEWSILKGQLNKTELSYFVKKYNKMAAQFGGDVLASEETQIVHLLKFEILMNRVMRMMKTNQSDIIRLSREIGQFREKKGEGKLSKTELEMLINMEDKLAGAKASQGAKTGEYQKLQAEHRGIMKDLKGTRDQRLEKIQEATKDFMGMIKALEDKEFRDTEGRQLELVRKAVQQEEIKLRKKIVYNDGVADSPILDYSSEMEDSNE